MLFALGRHDADGDGVRSAGHLPGARSVVAGGLRAHRASAATRATGTEAAFKYFLLGAFSSAFFLYGIAFTYGVTGSTRLDRIGSLIAAQAMSPTPMQLLASACCWSASRSRCRRCRFTCGRPTPTKARRPRSPASCRPASRRRRSPRSCACFSRRSSRCAASGAGALGHRGGDDDRRRGGRRRAVERQADARLFEHRARRLPAGRAACRRTMLARARSSSIC